MSYTLTPYIDMMFCTLTAYIYMMVYNLRAYIYMHIYSNVFECLRYFNI